MMEKKFFSGTCTAVTTPFYQGGIDYPTLEKILLRQLQAGIHAIVIAGTTGEGSTLSDSEKADLVAYCKQTVGSGSKVIAGSGSNCTHHAIELSLRAQEQGADGLLIVSPYYNKASPEGLIAHYRAIAEAVDIPIIVYNVPSRTGMDIPVWVYRELSGLPNICGVKEAASDIRKIQEIRGCCPDHFGIWSGNDDMICASMATGADGVISVASNIAPAEVKSLTDAALYGNYREASRLQRYLLPLIGCLFCQVNPIPVKYAMHLMGLDRGGCRLPLTCPSEQFKEQIYSVLSQMNFI